MNEALKHKQLNLFSFPKATICINFSLNIKKSTGTLSRIQDYVNAKRFLLTRGEKYFLLIYRKHSVPLYNYVLRKTFYSHSDTEDLVQETWMRAVEGLGKFKWKSSFKTWLFAIAENCLREKFREKEKRSNNIKEKFFEVEILENRSDNENIDFENAVQNLPEGSKEILMLYEFHRFKHKEIAEILGINEGTSKSQLHKARQKIKQFLSE